MVFLIVQIKQDPAGECEQLCADKCSNPCDHCQGPKLATPLNHGQLETLDFVFQ